MKILRNEKGFALGFVLILATVALGMTLAMLFMLGRGSYVSGQQKRYQTAVEATRGGVEAMLQLIASRGTTTIAAYHVMDCAALQSKLNNFTDNWVALDNAIAINPDVSTTYDVRLDLGTYRAYGKIVDTVTGNSGMDEGLLKSGVVNANAGEVVVMSIPFLYTVEVLAQSAANPTERSKMSVLYQY